MLVSQVKIARFPRWELADLGSFVSLFFVGKCEDFCEFLLIVGSGCREFACDSVIFSGEISWPCDGNHGGIDLLNLSLRGS